MRIMFIGEYSHNIDEKGRLAIPVKFRKLLGEGAVVTKGLDDCLFLYPSKEWSELAQKLARLPINQSNTRALSRLMLAGAMDMEIDKQGRVILPEYLREYGGLKKKVVVIGLYNRVEIWDEEKWGSYKSGTERASGQIAEALGELGL